MFSYVTVLLRIPRKYCTVYVYNMYNVIIIEYSMERNCELQELYAVHAPYVAITLTGQYIYFERYLCKKFKYTNTDILCYCLNILVLYTRCVTYANTVSLLCYLHWYIQVCFRYDIIRLLLFCYHCDIIGHTYICHILTCFSQGIKCIS